MSSPLDSIASLLPLALFVFVAFKVLTCKGMNPGNKCACILVLLVPLFGLVAALSAVYYTQQRLENG